MNETGLTAYIVTLHTPAAVLGLGLGLLVAVFVLVVLHKRPLASRAWIALLWCVGTGVVGYASACRVVDVRSFDLETVSLF